MTHRPLRGLEDRLIALRIFVRECPVSNEKDADAFLEHAERKGVLQSLSMDAIGKDELQIEITECYKSIVSCEDLCMQLDKVASDEKVLEKPESLLDRIRDDPGLVQETWKRFLSTDEFVHDPWSWMLVLHLALLAQHHEFMVAIQHPSGTEDLRSLIAKHGMPRRAVKHGVVDFLSVLEHHQHSYQTTFGYLARAIMMRLKQRVQGHNDTWNECIRRIDDYVGTPAFYRP